MENRLPLREEVPEELTWKLSDIYESTELWEKDFTEAEKEADDLAAMAGSLTDGAGALLKALDIYESCMQKVYKLYSYSEMKSDQNTMDQENLKLFQRAQSLDVKISEKLSFLERDKKEDFYDLDPSSKKKERS